MGSGTFKESFKQSKRISVSTAMYKSWPVLEDAIQEEDNPNFKTPSQRKSLRNPL